jgi:hypothetical protein
MAKSGQQHTKADEGGKRVDTKKATSQGARSAASGAAAKQEDKASKKSDSSKRG